MAAAIPSVLENDIQCYRLIVKCWTSHLRRKFLKKEGIVMLDDLLGVARSQEAVDRQLKQCNTNQATRSMQ